ncbi:cupin domain-containing protein [Pseudomonas violetae]|jgi:quercetin dioxygenase-like cupin family protein|uniref:Cupin domain-containing protein n=1 Tax=Pseudomonas violetae TaxID=2915813 RepID=A0ABT0F266_9PSED|nr:cupin domain-containing protein [Pseudomonas violetae]MCK1792105.1 cupin domain-containing protein [Pseudomonas violetae]
MKTRALTSLLVTTLAVVILPGCSQEPAPTAIERKVLLQGSTSWDGTSYTRYPDAVPELSLLKLKIPANTELNWHKHPTPNAAYILSGELTVESRDSGQVRSFKQGEALAEMVDIIHRGKTGDKPVELIVFYAGSQGIPLSE